QSLTILLFPYFLSLQARHLAFLLILGDAQLKAAQSGDASQASLDRIGLTAPDRSTDDNAASLDSHAQERRMRDIFFELRAHFIEQQFVAGYTRTGLMLHGACVRTGVLPLAAGLHTVAGWVVYGPGI